MTRESASNMVAVCKEHAPVPKAEFVKAPPSVFVGRFVKKGFPVQGSKTGQQEFMWVFITHVEDGSLVGCLDNDPSLSVGVKCGDIVRVLPSEVCDVYAPDNGRSDQCTGKSRSKTGKKSRWVTYKKGLTTKSRVSKSRRRQERATSG